MFYYETHLHTSPVSKCGKATVEENLIFYKALGYDGIFITNHFLDGNIGGDRTAPYEEQIQFYFSDYEKAVELGKAIGIKVFCGVEISYKGTDFLVYGLDKQWYLEHPEIMEMKKSRELPFLMESGALVIQAHPYRDSDYIDHIRLFPKYVHGVEVMNTSRPEQEQEIARLYAQHYGLIQFAGSDNHAGANRSRLSGMCSSEPIVDEKDFVAKVLAGEMDIFVKEV